MRDRIFHHAPLSRIADWLSCGWLVVLPNGPMHHHHYGLMLEWLCDCKPPRPK